MIGKYISAFGKVEWACFDKALSCLIEVCLASWSLLFSPMEKTIILTDGLVIVFSHILRK